MHQSWLKQTKPVIQTANQPASDTDNQTNSDMFCMFLLVCMYVYIFEMLQTQVYQGKSCLNVCGNSFDVAGDSNVNSTPCLPHVVLTWLAEHITLRQRKMCPNRNSDTIPPQFREQLGATDTFLPSFQKNGTVPQYRKTESKEADELWLTSKIDFAGGSGLEDHKHEQFRQVYSIQGLIQCLIAHTTVP